MKSQPIRRIAIFSLASFALGLALSALPAQAQRDRPGVVTEEIQRLYGTRHLLPFSVPAGAPAAKSSLRVTNTGWGETHVLVVELSPVAVDCATGFDAGRVLSVHCESGLQHFASTEIELSGQDSIVRVYSLDPALAADACAAFAPVQRGEVSLAEWEERVQRRSAGEPLVVLGEAEAGETRAAMTSLASLALPSEATGRIAVSKALAAIPDVSGSNRLRLVNASSQCAQFEALLGLASDTADCAQPRPQSEELGPLGVLDMAPTLGGTEMGALNVLRSGRRPAAMLQLTAAIDHRDEDLWLRHAATTLTTPEGSPMPT